MNSHNVLAVVLFVLRWMPLHCFRTDGAHLESGAAQISNAIESLRAPDFLIITGNGSSNGFTDDHGLINYEKPVQLAGMSHYREGLKVNQIRTLYKPETEFRFYKASEMSRWTRIGERSVRSQTTGRITRKSPETRRDEQTRISRRRSETRDVRIRSADEESRGRRLENSQSPTRIRSVRRSNPETSRRQTFTNIRSRREQIPTPRNRRSVDTRQSLQIRRDRISESRSPFRREISVDNERRNMARESRNDLAARRDISSTEDSESSRRRYDSRRSIVRDSRNEFSTERNSRSNRRLESSSEAPSRRIDSSSEDSRDERISIGQRQRRDSRQSRSLLRMRRDDSRREARTDQGFYGMKDDQKRRNTDDITKSDCSLAGGFLIKVSVSLLALLLLRGETTAKSNGFFDFDAPNNLLKCIS